jgi:5'-phosphate synthase pdxT subunit
MPHTLSIGVLALQGDFAEHLQVLSRLEVEGRPIRRPEELRGVAGLILPGGESTTIGTLMERFGLMEAVREFAHAGRPIYGTCAGLILMAKEILDSEQPRLGLMDLTVQRNAYGRQVDSFEADIPVPRFGEPPLRAVFIRAPRIETVGREVDVLAEFEGKPVLVQQGPWLASAFHPELTSDVRVHRYFLQLAREA